MKTYKTSILASAVALGMVACGGGGDNSSASASTTSESDQFVGTWADSTCQTSLLVQEATGQPNAGSLVHQKRQLTLSKTGDTTLSATVVTKFYAVADTGCTGTVLTTETRNSYTVTVGGGSKSMTYNAGIVTATKLNVSGAAIGGVSSGSRVEVGSLSYPGSYFTVATNDDYYVYVYESGKFAYELASASTFGTARMIRGAPF